MLEIVTRADWVAWVWWAATVVLFSYLLLVNWVMYQRRVAA